MKEEEVKNEEVEAVEPEVLEESVEEYNDSEVLEDYGEDIEERVVNAEDVETDNIEVELHHFDCDEILGFAGEKAEVDAQTDKIAGEIARRKLLLGKLLQKSEEVYLKIKAKRDEIKDRYDLSNEYNWTIDVYEGVAKGVKKV